MCFYPRIEVNQPTTDSRGYPGLCSRAHFTDDSYTLPSGDIIQSHDTK